MKLRNSLTGYGVLARGLHWSMAILIICLIGLGVYMTSQADGDPKWALYDLHKSLGVLAFFLLLARIVWRHVSPPPPLPASMSAQERFAAHAGHGLLYLAMLMLPVTGYLDSAFGGYHINIFGLIEVPMLLEKNTMLFELTVTAHQWIGYGLGGLILIHAGAALKHHFINKDGVLLRMVKGDQV